MILRGFSEPPEEWLARSEVAWLQHRLVRLRMYEAYRQQKVCATVALRAYKPILEKDSKGHEATRGNAEERTCVLFRVKCGSPIILQRSP